MVKEKQMCGVGKEDTLELSVSSMKSTPYIELPSIEAYSEETYHGYVKLAEGRFFVVTKREISEILEGEKTIISEEEEECDVFLEEFLSFDWERFFYDDIVNSLDLMGKKARSNVFELYWETKAKRKSGGAREPEKRWLHDDGTPVSESEAMATLRPKT